MPKPSVGLTTWQVLRLLWHLPNFARLYWRLFTDRQVPLRAKAILIAAVLYVLDWFIFLCPPDVVQDRVREISEE